MNLDRVALFCAMEIEVDKIDGGRIERFNGDGEAGASLIMKLTE